MSPRLLLVEDSPTQALELQWQLEQHGMQVLVVASAEEALRSLSPLPDVVLLDNYLPDMRGEELCRRLRQMPATRALPILLLTGANDEGLEARALHGGADGYLGKHVEFDVLLARICGLLRRSATEAGPRVLAPPQVLGLPRICVAGEVEGGGADWLAALAREGFEVHVNERSILEPLDDDCDALLLPAQHCGDPASLLKAVERKPVEQRPVLIVLGGSGEGEGAWLQAGADDVISNLSDPRLVAARLQAQLRRRQIQQEQCAHIREAIHRELESRMAKVERDALSARAALADELDRANRELRETQAQLVHSAKMAALGQLVAGLAHEINNPLAYLIAHNETVRRCLDELSASGCGETPEQAVRIDKAGKRAREMGAGLERIRDLVQRMRQFARLDQGEIGEIELGESLDSALLLLEHRMRGRIEVVRHFDQPVRIECMPGPLHQLMLNLMANAIDAIEGAGSLVLRTGESEGVAWFSVQDDGCGVPEDLLERVFDPFFTTKPPGEGTGLGLSLAYRIVQGHRGSISLLNRKPQGCVALVKLPSRFDGSPSQVGGS
jgi:two-component system, NtrC family, sensor kinase